MYDKIYFWNFLASWIIIQIFFYHEKKNNQKNREIYILISIE